MSRVTEAAASEQLPEVELSLVSTFVVAAAAGAGLVFTARAAATALLVAVAVAAGAVLVFKQLAVPSATVPDVQTLDVDAARAKIDQTDRAATDVKWSINERAAYNDNVEAGIVISQETQGGKKLDDGGTITIVVSRGPRPVALPEIDGATLDAAKVALGNLGFKVGAIEQQNHETIPEGTLITWKVNGQERPAEAPKGSTVDLVVSSGPAPRTVPDVRGRTEADAKSAIEGLGLVAIRADAFDDEVPLGQVIRTDPAAGQQVARGSRVTYVVSKGPDLVTVPNVIGMSRDNAEATITAAGLNPYSVGPPGKVVNTNPRPDKKVKRGSTVTLYTAR